MKNNFYLRSKILLLFLITFACIDVSAQSISSNSPVCEAKKLQLTSSGGVSYSWSGPNGFTSTLQNPQILNATLPKSGVYSVAIIDANSNVSTATTNVTINPTPVPPSVQNYVSCEGEPSFILSAAPSATNMQLLWYGNNATGGVSSTVSPIFFPIAPGITTYYVSQRSNITGCESARSEILVIVHPKPFPPIVTDKTYTQGEAAVSLNANSHPAFTLFWYGMSSSGGVGSVVAPTPNTSTVGITNFYVSNKDNLTACESNRSKITVTVNSNVVITAPQISSNKIKLCDGENAILTAAGCAGTITWSNGFTGSSISINSAGTYNAFCTVGGNQSPNSENIVITTLSRNPITISSSNGQLCLNTAITLTSSVCQEGTITWNNGATGTSIQVSAAGTYAAQCINPCGTSPNSNILTISQSGGVPSAPVISTNKTILCSGEAAVLIASGCVGTVIWNNGMTPSSIQITQSGTYTAICRNLCGDSNSSNFIIIRTFFTPTAPTVSTTKTLICNGETATLTASGCNGTIRWNNGMTSNSIQVSTTGIYSAVCQNICGDSQSSNSVVINSSTTPSSPTISANKVILCNGETATLTATGCAGMVQWSNGATPNSIQLSVAGTYTATCVNACGVSLPSNSIILRTNNSPTAPTVTASNTVICGQGTATLTASGCNGTILWNNAQTANQISVNTVGTYTAQCQNTCGQSSISNAVTITRNNANCAAISVCSGANLVLSNATIGIQYSWAGPNGFTSTLQNPQISHVIPIHSGVYTSTVIDANNNISTATTNVVVNQSPIAVAVGSVVCQSGVLTLSALNTNPAITGVSYSWSGPSGFVSNLQNPSLLNANFTNAGIYIVTLTSSNGCTATASANVIVNPTPVIVVSTNSPICEGENLVMFSTVANGTSLIYNWTGPNGFTSNQSNVTIANAQSTQTGIYQLSVSSSNACISSVSVNVVVNPKPVSPAVQNVVACKTTNPIILSATANVGNELVWYGFASTNGFGSTVAPVQDTSVVGTRSYYVSQRNLTTGCESARTALVTQVLPNPSMPQVFNKTMCQGMVPDSLIVIPTDGNTVIWYGMNASGGEGSTTKVYHNPTVAGIFKYYVSQKNILGCESERAELVVTVNAKPLAPTGNNITSCEGDAPVTLSAIALPNYTLYWDNYSTTPPTHNPTTAGSFTYNVRQRENLANACLSDLKPIIVLVKPKPVVSIMANTPLNVGQTLQFGSTVSAGTNYSWSGPNGFSSTIQNPKIVSVTTNHAGIYTFTGNLNGCSTTATIQVTIAAPSIKIYDDALKANWLVYTTATTKNLANTSPVQSGTKSISVKHTKATANIEFATYHAQSLAGMTHLKFWIHGGTVGSQKVAIKINNISTKYNVVATKNVWTLVNIPLSYFGNPGSLYKIIFMNNATTSQAVYYLDNIYLAGSANARIASSETSAVVIEEEVIAENNEVIKIEKAEFSIYPNPVVEQHSTLNLSLKGFDNEAVLKVELLDNQGIKQKDYILNINEKQNSIEIPSLDSGIYMIRITDGKKVALKRLIVN